MIVLERLTQKVHNGKWAELEKLEKKFNTLEAGFGFPPKKRYQYIAGSHAMNTLIIERQWDSLAKMETAYAEAFANEDYQKLSQETISVIKSNQMELLTPLP